MNFSTLCKEIMNLDPLIRFGAILDKSGERVAGGYRNNVSSKLSPNEIRMSLSYAGKRDQIRKNFVHRIGKVEYSMTIYEKINQFTIPLNEDCLLMISTEKSIDHEKIVSQVLNLLQNKYEEIDFYKYLKCPDCKDVMSFCLKHKLEVENFVI